MSPLLRFAARNGEVYQCAAREVVRSVVRLLENGNFEIEACDQASIDSLRFSEISHRIQVAVSAGSNASQSREN